MTAVRAPGANAGQRARWNEDVGLRWLAIQDALDHQLREHGEAALDDADLGPGDRVLDVGCGCGASSVAAARRVTPGGHVLGVDLSLPMLARARQRAAAAGLGRVRFVQTDAQRLALAASRFDAVVSRFGVAFFDSPVHAFARLRAALVPGGRLAFVCWQSMARNRAWAAPLGASAATSGGAPAHGAPGPFALAEGTEALLRESGFERVRLAPLEGTMPVGRARGAAEAAEVLLEMGPGAVAARRSEALRRRLLAALAEALAPYEEDGCVRVPYAAWRVCARA